MNKLSSIFICLLLCYSSSFCQVKILDSNVDWSPKTLTVYLSDTVATGTLNLKVGSTYGATDVLNTNYSVGSTLIVADNRLVVSLSALTAGAYFIDLSLIVPGTDPVQMQYQCTY